MNLICKCDHGKDKHIESLDIYRKYGSHFCDACAMDPNRIENWMPAYHDFKVSNLKTLAYAYAQKNSK